MAEATATAQPPGWRRRLGDWIDSEPVQRVVITLIVLNAILFGLETSRPVMDAIGPALHVADRIILGVFIVEIGLRLIARGLGFFRDAWAVFDLVVVGFALAPATGSLAALRALRVLRLLRLVRTIPSMRRVVEGLLQAVPGMGAIALLLLLILYVAAVIATNLFGPSDPELFGDLGRSLLTLFQVLTLEGWPDIQRAVMAEHPLAWLFFVPFVVVTTLAVLNLFVAVIVDSMQASVTAEAEEVLEETHIREELIALRAEIAGLRRDLAGK